jgi:putative transposase
MPRLRKTQVSLDGTPCYHCSSRCVRRAFLYGEDAVTGESFAHRRQWIEDKLFELATIFAIDSCAHSVMHNHYHVVVFIDKSSVDDWQSPEVVERAGINYLAVQLIANVIRRVSYSSAAEQTNLERLIALWRERLIDISWFKRIINEGIARMANREDDYTGRFWEGRFPAKHYLMKKN